ncbi:UPF0223 family protein [Leuconostocaceae bacterium ESL0958]|nr:UPF0223 family protein [Leuconostocaceae bacterium ESL0958]
MKDAYQLPIDGNWTTTDIIMVSNLVDAVMKSYESGCDRDLLLSAYRDFCLVMPAKSEQKAFDRDFGRQTGYSIYQTIQLAQGASKKVVYHAAK